MAEITSDSYGSSYGAAAGSACLEAQRGVIGDYKIEYETLGVGSNATVRLGYHLPTGEKVAVKIIDITTPQVRERAYLEAEVLRKLKNDNIIRLFAIVELGQFLYLFLEYVAGGDLASYIQRYGRLEEHSARKYFQQIVKAVEHCHEAKVAHHDIKLENILITFDKKSLRLIDFGLCTRITEEGPITNYAGSPLFMSPEVFSLQPHSEAVDIWSLGVCLYKIVTDIFPFMADIYNELEERVLFDDVAFPLNMGLTNSLKDLVSKMLAKDPKQRITLKEIKAHPWLTNNARDERPDVDEDGCNYYSYRNGDYDDSDDDFIPTGGYFEP